MCRDGHEFGLEPVEFLELCRHRSEALGKAAELIATIAADGEWTLEMSLGDGAHSRVEFTKRRADGSRQPECNAEGDEDRNAEGTQRENGGILGTYSEGLDEVFGSGLHRIACAVEDAIDRVERRGNHDVDDGVSTNCAIRARKTKRTGRLLDDARDRRTDLPDCCDLRELCQRVGLAREGRQRLLVLPFRILARCDGEI